MIKLEGMEQLVRRIEQLGSQGEGIRDEAVQTGGDYLQEKVKENIYSMGLHEKSGDLREAIVVSHVKDGKVDVGLTNQGTGFYGYFHEFGATDLPARPFLAPTFEREKETIERIMSDTIRRGLGL